MQVGLEEGIELDYLTYRIKQVRSRPTLLPPLRPNSAAFIVLPRAEKGVFEWYVSRCAP